MMGASCSICDSNKVVEINIPKSENQHRDLTDRRCPETVILESNLLMNFAPNLPETSDTTVSETSIESICSEIENAVLQQDCVPIKQTEEPSRDNGKAVDSPCSTQTQIR